MKIFTEPLSLRYLRFDRKPTMVTTVARSASSTKITSQGLGQQLREHRRVVLAVILLAGALYAAVPQLGILGNSWSVILGSDWSLAILAIGILFASIACASGMYVLLSPKRLAYGRTYIVQVAGSFASRALPAGIGSISVNYLYLRAERLSKVLAASVVALNNGIGFMGHMVWVAIALLYAPTQLLPAGDSSATIGWLLACGIMVALLLGFVLRHRIVVLVRSAYVQLRRAHPTMPRLGLALVLSMALTGCYITILWLSGQALGLSYGFVVAVVALTTGVAAQTLTPTPGGLGGAEAGLVAGLVLGGIPAGDALATALLYRVITYWLPLILGGIALWYVLRRGYLE